MEKFNGFLRRLQLCTLSFFYTFLYNNLIIYIKVKLKENEFGVFLVLCHWIEVKDIVRPPAKAKSWLQEAVSIYRCV